MTTDDKDDDDDDFKPITPKEFHKINRNLYTSSESENEIHTDLKASSKATNFEEADQSLVKTVRDALGKAAFDAGQNSDFDTDDDNVFFIFYHINVNAHLQFKLVLLLIIIIPKNIMSTFESIYN